MRNSKGKTSSTIWHKLRISVLVVVCCGAVVGGAHYVYRPNFQKLRQMEVDIEKTRETVDQIERENEEYNNKMQKLREPPAGDPLYIEKRARETVGLVKDGETVYHLQTPAQQ